jgi:hypothetical protein
MNRQKIFIATVFLLLMGTTAGLIIHARAHQKQGRPGVLTRPLAGTHNLRVILPDQLPGFACQIINTQSDMVLRGLPSDTSYGTCYYTATNGFQCSVNVVLMGTDRTSIHKPQFCLTAQGWKIDDAQTTQDKIRLGQPFPYELPVMHLTATKSFESDGQTQVRSGVYVYWYVDEGEFTAVNSLMNWWIARDMLLNGVMDRFAYVAYFAGCEPGHEAQTFDRIKALITATVPKFQLVPRTPRGTGS